MAQSMHSSNSQDQKMKEYKAVAALININNVAVFLLPFSIA